MKILVNKIKLGRKYLLFPLFLAIILSGCAPRFISPERIAPIERERYSLGTLQNPVVDSNIALAEGLRKWAPLSFKSKQRLVEVLYYSFDGKIHKGQIIINKRLVRDIQEIFSVIFRTRFPIQSVIPISHNRFYNNGKFNDDDQSMMVNNTSGFNYRTATRSKKLSMHAYGYAIDINPLQNPYIKRRVVLPPGAVYNINKPGTLTRNSPVVKTFKRLGWAWGGEWKSLKDYQHFEKVLKYEFN
ncbi:MAG: M15 family metallopeptidase [Candidatus Omnitrophica bacterium]|nr:M15 family metallopeptidase [Candidatus Omnitrophota bacterium]